MAGHFLCSVKVLFVVVKWTFRTLSNALMGVAMTVFSLSICFLLWVKAKKPQCLHFFETRDVPLDVTWKICKSGRKSKKFLLRSLFYSWPFSLFDAGNKRKMLCFPWAVHGPRAGILRSSQCLSCSHCPRVTFPGARWVSATLSWASKEACSHIYCFEFCLCSTGTEDEIGAAFLHPAWA